MNGRILTCLGLSIVLPLIFAYRAAQVSVPPNADERLALSTSRPDYLLGEPVVLVLTFSNTSKESLKVVEVIVEPSHYEASIWISANGEAFQEFPRNSVVYKRTRQVFHLQPGDILQYKYRVVVGRL